MPRLLAPLTALISLLLVPTAQGADPPFRPLGSFDRVAVAAQAGHDTSGNHKVWVVSRESSTKSASVEFLDRSAQGFSGHRGIAWTPGAATLASSELVFPGPNGRLSLYEFPSPAARILDSHLDPLRGATTSAREVGRPRWIGTSTGTRLLIPLSQAGVVSIRPDGSGASVLPGTAGRGVASPFAHDLFADGRRVRASLGETTTEGQWSNLSVDVLPTGSRQLMDTPFIDEAAPSLSPDGSEIAFRVDGFLRVIPSDGGTSRHITPDTSFAYGPPAWLPDGSRIAFVALSPRVFSKPALYSVKPDGSDFVRHTAQFGDSVVPPAFPGLIRLGETQPRISWGRTCTTIQNCNASLTVVRTGPAGATIQSTPQLPQAASIGFLVERYKGRRLRRAGRVPFGTKRRGRARVRWGLRLNGRRLRSGRYRITLRALARGVPVDTARPRDLIVRRGKPPRLVRTR